MKRLETVWKLIGINRWENTFRLYFHSATEIFNETVKITVAHFEAKAGMTQIEKKLIFNVIIFFAKKSIKVSKSNYRFKYKAAFRYHLNQLKIKNFENRLLISSIFCD